MLSISYSKTIKSFCVSTLLFCLTLVALSCGGGDGTTDPGNNTVASVVVSPSTSTLTQLGATTTLSAVARNSSNAVVSGQTFSWLSLNTNIATVVAATGVVTAVAGGTATIRATVSGGSVSGTAAVTVQQTIATVAMNQTTATVATGATVQLSATARDAGGGAVAGTTFTWSSASTNIASVNPTTGLVSGVAVGSALITAAAGGQSASITVTVTTPPLIIAKDTTLSGNVNVDGLSIAAGFTVTVNGPLTLRSTRLISIAGTVIGNCHAFDIQGDTAVVINGTVNNGCSASAAGAPLRIAANGELIVQNAQIRSSGPITLLNDPALGASLFHGRGSLAGLVAAPSAGLRLGRFGNSTIRYNGDVIPQPAPPGTNGVNGGAAADGEVLEIRLAGNAEFAGNTLLWGEDGGAGGTGTNTGTANVTVFGGRGGAGGLVKLIVAGSLTYTGTNNIIRSGAGGRGGNATATTTTTTVGTKAATASSVGGNGGNPGLVEIQAGGGIFINAPSAVALEIGSPGDGGDALSTSAHGVNSNSSRAAQGGGDAIGRGGNGGSTPDALLVKLGTVTGTPIVRSVPPATEINGGRGGQAKTIAGNGGTGNMDFRHGANGGGMNAIGGVGGDALLRGINAEGLGFGGAGGLAWMLGGNGGNGWNSCVPGGFQEGGFGAFGGGTSGTAGVPGAGRLGAGFAGLARFEDVANGGNAGGGNPPGNPGGAGNKTVNGAQTSFGETFTAGDPGQACPLSGNPAPAGPFFLFMGGWPGTNSAGDFVPGSYTRPLSTTPGGSGVMNTEVIISTESSIFGAYHQLTFPVRIGFLSGGHGFDINIVSVKDGAGAFVNVGEITVCFLNENPPPSPANPIIIRQKDNGFMVDPLLVETEISGPSGLIIDGRAGCRTIPRFKQTATPFREATHVEILRPNGSVQMDYISFKPKPPSP